MARRKKTFKPLRSGLERIVHDQLVESGIGFEYEPEKIEYRTRVVNGICTKCGCTDVYQRRKYTPDFVLSNGIRLEVKGILDAPTRSKMVAIKTQNPGLDVRFVFGANNKVNKKKPARYLDWAAHQGFKACLKLIPPSWLR